MLKEVTRIRGHHGPLVHIQSSHSPVDDRQRYRSIEHAPSGDRSLDRCPIAEGEC